MEREDYQDIKEIFIANVLECYYKSYKSMNAETEVYWNLYDKLDGNRSLLYGKDNKIIITSVEINKEHFENTRKLMGWKNVVNLYPNSSTESISFDIINNPGLLSKVVRIIKDNPGVSIIPYKATEEFYELLKFLKSKELIFNTPETIKHEFSFIHNYANSKRGFRHLWAHAIPYELEKKINIPLGFITADKDEAIEAGRWFYEKNKSFVVKYSKGTQGIGILIVKKEDLPEEKKEFGEEMNRLMDEQIWEEPVIVVEELIDIDKNELGGSPSIEFYINPDGEVIPTYACEQLLASDRKTFEGVYIHPELEGNKYIKIANEAGIHFGKELAGLGYRGNFDIDLVISTDGKVYAVESNLRRTGGTHIQHAAISLLGENFIQKYHVAGQDIKLGEKTSYHEALQKLHDLQYTKQKDNGFIFSNPDMLHVDVLNIIMIAKSKAELLALRDEIKRRVSKAKLHLDL